MVRIPDKKDAPPPNPSSKQGSAEKEPREKPERTSQGDAEPDREPAVGEYQGGGIPGAIGGGQSGQGGG